MTNSTPSPAANLPCPFCASEVSQIRLQGWPQRECLQCGALGPKQSHATPEWNWNVRAATLTAPDTAVAVGYKLVPIEPTRAMIEAGCEHNPTQWNDRTDDGFSADVANDVYVAMVNAAPAPPAEG